MSSKYFISKISLTIIMLSVICSLMSPVLGAEKRTVPKQLPINRPEQITSQTEPVLYFDISRDNKWMVYTTGPEESCDIWIRSIDTGGLTLPRRLTDDPSSEFSPVFSPDGKFIAYVGTSYDVKGDIYLLEIPNISPLEKGESKRVMAKQTRLTGRETEDGAPCFSPDGNTLYFHQTKPGNTLRQIVSISLSDPNQQPKLINTGGDAAFPSISPDGKKLAFVSYRENRAGNIFVLDLQTGDVTAMTHGSYMDFFPAWSPDSTHVLFSRLAMDTDHDGSITTRDNAAIYTIGFGDKTPYPLTSANYSAFQPRIVGSKIFFLSNQGGISNCWALPLEGEITAAGSAEAQLRLAEEISLKIPYDPYVTLLAFYKVLEKFSDQPQYGAKAAYQLGKIYQNISMPEPADEIFGMVMNVQPWSSLSKIEQTVIHTRTKVKNIPDTQRLKLIDESLSEISRISDDALPIVQARKEIEKARLLIDVGKESSSLLKATTLLDRVIQNQASPREASAEAMILKADVYNLMGRPEEVYRAYLSVINTYPDVRSCADEAVNRILQITLTGKENTGLEDKVQLLRKIAEENREKNPLLSAGALNRVGDLYFSTDAWASAKSAYHQVLEQFPIPSSQTAAARLSLAEILYREERFRQALDLYETEIGLRPYDDNIYHLARDGYIRKSISAGEYLYRIGEIYSARKTFKELIDYDDTIVEAHRGYIKCAAALKETNSVLSVYASRLEKKPDDSIAIYGKALSLTYLEDKTSFEQARNLLMQAILINGRIEYFHQTLGYVQEVLETVHHEKGGLEMALDSYQKAYFLNDHKNNSDNAANLLLNQGNTCFLLSQYGKAFEYYMQRLDAQKPFDNPNTEILFYSRLGSSAFQAGESQKTIPAFSKTLDLINARMEPQESSRAFDKIVRFVMDRLISPALTQRDLKEKASVIAKAQSEINRKLSNLTQKISPPPSPEWAAYKTGIESLLAEQEKLNPDIILFHNSVKDSGLSSEEVRQTFTILLLKVRESLAFPERMIQLKAEMLDRLGLAYQDTDKWETAMETFKQVLTLNREMGLNYNLARNKRSIAYNAYLLSGTLSGEARRSLLKSAANDFTEVIDLVKKYGVQGEEKKQKTEGKALISISTQVSLDAVGSTQAAHGFSSVQEIRLAEAFISRINTELGELIPAEKAILEQLAPYPIDKPVSDKDLYGVSLLYHRAGLMESAKGKFETAYHDFRYSAELCLRMQNPVSAAINTTNMAQVIMSNQEPGIKNQERLKTLELMDREVSQLLSAKLSAIGSYPVAAYHNKMGVYYSKTESGTRKQKELNNIDSQIFYIRALQQAGIHFSQGIETLEKDEENLDRNSFALLAVLHLNMGRIAPEFGETDTVHFEKALELSNRAMLPDLKWRSLAELSRFDEGLEALESVTILRAGCGSQEITSAFSQRVADLIQKGQTEEAFNFAERLSEIERFNRLAFFINEIPEKEKTLYRSIYPRLVQIQELRKNLQAKISAEEKQYIQDKLKREVELVESKIGKDGQNLSDVIRLIPDTETRERIIMLLGIAAHAEEIAEGTFKLETPNPETEYKRLINNYKKLKAEAKKSQQSDIFSFFGAEPVEAIDVMENLPKDNTLVRLFKIPSSEKSGGRFILFTLTSDEIKASIINSLENLPGVEKGIQYAAYENPLELKAAKLQPTALSATHFVRSIKSRKPFKRSVLTVPPFPDASSILQGVHTLIASRPVIFTNSVPTRAGEYPEHLLAIDGDTGPRIRMENLLHSSTSLSLALLPNTSSDALYLVGHLFSLYQCPTVVQYPQMGTESSLVEAFLKAYAGHSAFDSLIESESRMAKSETAKAQSLLLGYIGMTPDESKIFAEKKFAEYVKNGRQAFDANKPGEALSQFENAVQIANESESFRQYLADLYRFSRESAYKSENLNKSLEYAKLLAELMNKKQPDSEAHAESLLRLGLIYAKLEQYDKSIPVLEQAVEMVTNLELGEPQISALTDLGVVLENATEYDRALGSFQSAAALSRNLNKKELLAKEYSSIGRIYDLRMSQYAMAIQSYQKSLTIYRELGQNDGIAQSLLNVGRCYRLLGNFVEADRHYEEALSLSSGNIEIKAKVLIEQANNAWFQARYQEAFNLQRTVYQMAKEHNLALMKIIALNTSGLIWWTFGDQQKALDELKLAMEAAQAFKGREDEVATTWNNTGIVYREMRRYKEALDAFDKAMAIDTKLKSRWGVAYDLRNKGQTLVLMGQANESIPLFIRASEEAHAIGNRINEAKALLGLGDAYFALEKHTEAESAFQQALNLSKSMLLRETQWRAIYGLAKLQILKNRETAEQMLREAVSVIETMRADIKIEQLRDSFITNKLAVYETLAALLADMGKTTEAFEIAERSRSRNFIDLLGNQRISLGNEIDQKLYERQKLIRLRIEEHEALLAQSKEAPEREAYQKALDRLQSDLKDLMLEIQAQNPQLASIVSIEPASANQVIQKLEPGVAILAYYVLPQEIMCWLMKSEGIQLFRTPVGRESFGQAILDYRRMTQNIEPLEEQSKQFTNWLIAPAKSNLNGIKTLGIIPHGPLHYLSFATLSDGNEYLIDRFSLFYLPSASVLDFTMKRRSTSPSISFKKGGEGMNVLAIGNPDLGDAAFDLPFAEYEVGSIKWNFPTVTTLTREKATESWVVRNIGKFKIIHIASHGEFNPINPLFSAIKLKKDSEADGNLEASEVFGLRIKADLVVLSACQTGLAKITSGDDVIGLNRSFFYAGTHAIISSLWRVSDVSTAILIKEFYRQYLSANKADSLRQAILHVKTLYPHPGYWGAFTLAGDYE